jgi:hypothetical protein
MKNILFALFFVLGGSLFSQNYNKGLNIILQSVDSTYFEESGVRWSDFSLTPRKYYKVMDLIDSDTTCGCMVLKGKKSYMSFVKELGTNETKKDRRFNKKIIGYLECRQGEYDIFMWVVEEEAFGFMLTYTID